VAIGTGDIFQKPPLLVVSVRKNRMLEGMRMGKDNKLALTRSFV